MVRKRLLIITNRYPSGPNDFASPFVHDLHSELKQKGVVVDIVSPYYEPFRNDTRYIDESVHLFKWSDGKKVLSQLPLHNPGTCLKIFNYFRNGYKKAEELIKTQDIAAILALWTLPSGYIAYRLSQRYEVPYAVWALGSDINSWAHLPVAGNLTMKVLHDARILFADGYELAMKVQRLSDRECHFLPSFHRLDYGRGIFGEEQNVFLFVGRMEKEKGIFDLLEAFRIFSQNHKDWQLNYIGAGRAEKLLQEKINKYGLENSVKCFGYLERKALNHLTSLSAAIMIPSHSDSLPLTFGEAMQSGKPVITSDVGDLPFFVDKYRVGYHYPVHDIKALAGKMELMTGSRDNFTINCRKVLADLNIEISANTIMAWLETLIGPSVGSRHEYAAN